jgi:ferritin-like metal-binding protein YciE
METNRLKHLYVEEMKDLYSAESQLVKALPKMVKAATSEGLRSGFEGHLGQTKEHVARLEKIFKALGESPKGKKCKGMEGLIKEGAENDRGRSRARRIGRGPYLSRSAGGAL